VLAAFSQIDEIFWDLYKIILYPSALSSLLFAVANKVQNWEINRFGFREAS